MVDIVDKATRSRMMSGIRGKNTKPEIFLRKKLFAKGFRFRLHSRKLPGKPDIVFPRYRAVILVHGCFWHGHHCHLFKWPSSNAEFWRKKIDRNREVDGAARKALVDLGWRVLTVWECAMKGSCRISENHIIRKAETWIRSGRGNMVLRGTGGKGET
jgi:DNA mismatch endonuclease (patch repair protein)